MKRLLTLLLLCLVSPLAFAAGGGGHESFALHADVDVTDQASLQRGAKLFVNYCAGCHEAKFMRYSRVAADLGIPEDVAEQTLIFDEDKKIGDTMTNAMRSEDAVAWLGAAPPDLSLTVRLRGADWVYTFLNTFYRDDQSATGFNNLRLPGTAMPHVLWGLQGAPEAVYEEMDAGTDKAKLIAADVRVPEGAGDMSPQEYRAATMDLVNFLAYVAEPARAKRERLGIYVLMFLGVLLVLTYLLKKEYWRDVH